VAETTKCGKLAELAKLADRTVEVSIKLLLAGRKLADRQTVGRIDGRTDSFLVARPRLHSIC